MPVTATVMKLTKFVPLTISQREDMLGAIIMAAGGSVGYANQGASTIFLLPSGEQRAFSGNENLAKVASALGVNIAEMADDATPMGGVALWKSREQVFDVLTTIQLNRSDTGFPGLASAITNELNARKIQSNVSAELLWDAVLRAPGANQLLADLSSTPFDKELRAQWANQVLSSLDAQGVEFLPLSISESMSANFSPMAKDDVRKMLGDFAMAAAAKNVAVRRFVTSVHARLYRRGVSLGLEGKGDLYNKPAFMDYDVLRELTRSYMAVVRGGEFQSSNLTSVQASWGKNVDGEPLTLDNSFDDQNGYLKSVLMTRHQLAAKATNFPREIYQSLESAIGEISKPLDPNNKVPDMILRNQVAVGYGVPSIYSPNAELRDKAYSALQGALNAARIEHQAQLNYDANFDEPRQQIREIYEKTIAFLQERDTQTPQLSLMLEKQWDSAFPRGTIAPGVPFSKINDVFVSFQQSSLDTLLSKVNMRLREHWQAIKPMEQSLLQDPHKDWSKIIAAIKSVENHEPPKDYWDGLRLVRVRFALESLAKELIAIKQKESLSMPAPESAPLEQGEKVAAEVPATTPENDSESIKETLREMSSGVGEINDPKKLLREMADNLTKLANDERQREMQQSKDFTAAMLEAITGRPVNFVDVTNSVDSIDGELVPNKDQGSLAFDFETAAPESVAEPQAAAVPEPAAEPQAAAAPEPAAEPQAAAAPEPAAEPQAAAAPDPAAEPQAAAAPAPEPAAEPDQETKVRQLLLEKYEHIVELAFDKNDDLKYPDQLDLFINNWEDRIGDVEQLSGKDLELAYNRAKELYGAMSVSKTSRALEVWADKNSDHILVLDELKATKGRIINATPELYRPAVEKAWGRHFSFVADETGNVAEWAPTEQVAVLAKQARQFAEAIAARGEVDWKAWDVRFTEATSEYALAKDSWVARASNSEVTKGKLAAYWEMIHESMNWLDVKDVLPAVKSMANVAKNDAAFEQLKELTHESDRDSPWLLSLDAPKQALYYVKKQEQAPEPSAAPSETMAAAPENTERQRMRR